MTPSPFATQLNEQVGYEFAASQQYIAIAVYYDADALPALAAHFYRQAVEERNHAMMIVQYLIDAEHPVAIPGVEAPRTEFGSIAEPIALALEQERRVSDQIAALVGVARGANDFQGEQFLQWFLKEQVEEVASMSTLLRMVERAGDENALLIEQVVAAQSAEGDDPTAPHAAGGAL